MSTRTRTRPPRRARPPLDPEARMALVEHLRELRDRVLRTVLGVGIATILCFVFVNPLVALFLGPVPRDVQVIAIQPAETFTSYFKVALTFGIVLSMPIIVYQLFRFLAPGLTAPERRWLLLSLPLITAFFLAGVLFCYTLVLPSALNFLLHFGSDTIKQTPRVSELLGFETNFLLAVGVTFELPPVMFMLAKLGILSAKRMSGVRRYVIVLAFIISAIITPTPDPINQTIVAVPIYLLYELGLLFARLA